MPDETIQEIQDSRAEAADPSIWAVFDMREASAYLHISTSRLYGMVERREVPFCRLGKRIVFRKSDLHGWLDGYLVRAENRLGEDCGEV